MMRTQGRLKLDNMSREKAELLQLLLDKRARQAQRIVPVGRTSDTLLPISWQQRRLWFIEQLEGGCAGYLVPFAVRLRGTLNGPALQQALDTVMQRHEILRAVLTGTPDGPMQKFSGAARFALTQVDLSPHADCEREAEVQRHKSEELHHKFSLTEGPLIRGRLLQVHASEHVLLITMHHTIADGWSKGVFIRELAELYGARCEGRPDALPPLPIQYGDYAQWQLKHLEGSHHASQLRYWCERLRGAPPQLELPTDRPRPAVQSYRGENVWLELDAPLTSKLKSIAQRYEMTPFMVICAAWAVLLSRLSGQEDIAIGTPVANRQRPEIEELIGLFVNTLVLRIQVAPDASVEQLLLQVKQTTLEAYDHQEVPFEQVVEALQPERTLSRNPIFQAMFVMHNEPAGLWQLPGLEVSAEEFVDEPAILDLFLPLEERGDKLVGSVNYAADLFDRETIERWLAGFVLLLRNLTDDLSARVGELQILSDHERRRVTEAFSGRRVERSGPQLIHQLVEAQAARTPQAIAVMHENRWVTYAELDARADQLARYLVSRGVVPGQLVGIAVERSIDMVVGLLGILKAGGAYLPLDPHYPASRLQYMLLDASPRVVLTQEKLRSTLPATQADVVALDAQWPTPAEFSDAQLGDIEVGARDPLYVIYTSGSTGRPKGTVMHHGAMANLIEWHRHSFPDNEGKRVLQFAALSFDVAFQEIFTTLSTGGCLQLLEEWQRRDARALATVLSSQQVQRLFLPPLVLQALAEALDGLASYPASLQDVITAGEQLRISHEIVQLFQRLPGCRLHNHYGPTETHVVTALTLSGPPEQWPMLPTIGRPIDNTQIYILDTRRQPVPVGVSGEMYIGGANLATGYLHRPELTAQRFIVSQLNPADPEARSYKTGDLARWRPDGTIEYQGRNDDQVKIRGFRIELGEIEAQLARHSQVKEAAVVVAEDDVGEKRLIAYISRRTESDPTAESMRAHLKGLLPEHMMPAAFVTLDSLPVTPSGKLDRRALPAPQFSEPAAREYEPPEGEIEQLVARAWEKLLRVERVGRHEDFFALGGHSLLATRVMSHLAHALEMDLPLRLLFENSTIAALSERILEEIAADVSMGAS